MRQPVLSKLFRRVLLGSCLLAVHCCLFPVPCFSQTVPVTTTNLYDGASPANGKICWVPVLASGVPTVYRKGGGGMGTVTPICANVVNGASSIAAIPDSCNTTPFALCWRVTLSTNNGGVLLGSCVQPSASNYWYAGGVDNFDNWSPSGVPLLASACNLFAFEMNGAEISTSSNITVSVNGASVASVTSITSIFVNGSVL